MADCSRGWGERCPSAKGPASACTCACGGENHGKRHAAPAQEAYQERLQPASTQQPTFFEDETYAGPRWRYGCTYRPAHGWHIPEGFIKYSQRPSLEFAHGTIDYPRELSEAEIASFELTYVGQTPYEHHPAKVASLADRIERLS